MSILSAISSLFYPKECPVCQKILVAGEKIFCSECLLRFPWADPDLQSMGDFFKSLPYSTRPEKLYSLFNYTAGEETKNLLFSIKYHNRPKLAYNIGRMLGEHLINHLEADIIIPVPLHPKRETERGYNQSTQIAKGVSHITGIPYCENILERILNTKTQTEQNREQRIASMNGAFTLKNSSAIENKRIILIDDVITTGATIGACLQAICETNVKNITLACVARTSL